MPAPQVEKVLGPAKRELCKAMRAFNAAAVGKSDYRSMALTVRHKGKIVGGLVGETYWGWMYVNVLWVSEKYRGKGFGRSLMQKAETEARKRGDTPCVSRQLHLSGAGLLRQARLSGVCTTKGLSSRP